MNSKIILVEGIPGSGKTTLINALLQEQVMRQGNVGTLINLSQAHTYKPIVSDEDNFYAEKNVILDHLSKILDLLTWNVSTAGSRGRLMITIDTLHLTHCHRPGNVSWNDVASFDKQLAAINCRLIFMKARPQTIWQRAILKRNEADALYLTKYQKRYGDTLEEVHQYYMTEQGDMEKLYQRSTLHKMILFSEDTAGRNRKMAYDFWQQ